MTDKITDLGELFAQEEAKAIDRTRKEMAAESADPVFQEARRKRSEALQRELEAAELEPAEDEVDDNEDYEGEDE